MYYSKQKVTQPGDAAVWTPPPPEPLKFASLPKGIPITRKEVDIIKLTAQFVAVYGWRFLCDLEKSKKSELAFMKSLDGKQNFYVDLAHGYSEVLLHSQKMKQKGTTATVLDGFFNLLARVCEKEDGQGVEMAMTDWHAFQFFVNMEYHDWPPPEMHRPNDIQPDAVAIDDAEPLSLPSLPKGITHKKLDIVKLTAQFVAVYGMLFSQDLVENVITIPEFEPHLQFMESSDDMHEFYDNLALGYSRVLRRSKKLKEKEGVEMAMVDLYAFEFFVQVERTDWESREPGYLAVRKNPLPQPEEPEPKRHILDESALVPENQFLAQHPGSSTIRVLVPNVNDGKVIEITVQSLSENVASLKEKIANKLELEVTGKLGFLKDNKSLAHYNVAAGDILTLSL